MPGTDQFDAIHLDVLKDMRIASPCTAAWEDMIGDQKKRHCSQCDLDVHNFEAMTRAEIEALVTRTNGRVCARLYKRADGTVLTADCPVGLAALRARSRLFIARAVACTAALFSAALLFAESDLSERSGQTLSKYQPFKWAHEQLAPTPPMRPMGLLGKVCPPTPRQAPIAPPRAPNPTSAKENA